MTGTLVMWSGGIDSTLLLYRLASGREENIHAHHIILKDHRNRWGDEEVACRSIKQYFRKQFGEGRVLFSESVIELQYPGPQHIGVHDIYVAAIAAAGYVQCDPSVSRVWIGLHAGEIGNPSCRAWERHKKVQDLFRLLVERTRPHFENIEFPLRNMSKEQIVWELPRELMDLTFSCQQLRLHWKHKRCGKCITCQDLSRSSREAKKWPTPVSSGTI